MPPPGGKMKSPPPPLGAGIHPPNETLLGQDRDRWRISVRDPIGHHVEEERQRDEVKLAGTT